MRPVPVEERLARSEAGEDGPGHERWNDAARRQEREPADEPRPAVAPPREHDGDRERGPPGRGLVLEERGDSHEQARCQHTRGAACGALVAERHHGERERAEHQQLAVHGQHVVAEEGGAPDEKAEAGGEPPAVVAEERRSAEGDERHDEQDGQQPHGQHPVAEQLGRRVVGEHERRLVVRERHVGHPAPQHLARSRQVDGLVEVDRRHAQQHGPREERECREEQEPQKNAGTMSTKRILRMVMPGKIMA